MRKTLLIWVMQLTSICGWAQRDAFFDKVDFFRDPKFWQDYNIIEPSESLDKAISKLLKKYR